MSDMPTPGIQEQATADRELCGLVNALARRIDGHVRDRASALDLTAAQAVALRELTEPMTVRELADRMTCKPSNATFIIDRLEEKGIVRRHPGPRDRRIKQVVLTDDGLARRQQLLAVLTIDSPLQTLTPAEQQNLQQLLARAVSAQ